MNGRDVSARACARARQLACRRARGTFRQSLPLRCCFGICTGAVYVGKVKHLRACAKIRAC
eukprot:4357537-Pleurochrysis_carterae.AAC.1